MTQLAKPDRVRLTILYLRLWKLCDLQFYEERGHDSSKFDDVVPIDAPRLRLELEKMAATSLGWVSDPDAVRDEISETLELVTALAKDRSESKLATLDALRKSFQRKAYDYAGEITLANEASR